jgi:hypothetical protein
MEIRIFFVATSTTHRFHWHASVLEGVGRLQNLEEIFFFLGNCAALPSGKVFVFALKSRLEKEKKVKVLMLLDFGAIGDHPVYAGFIRAHPALERVTLTMLPGGLPYAYLDAYVMGFAGM